MHLPPLLAIGLSHFPLIHPSSIRAAIPLKNSAPTPRQQRSRHGGDREAPAPTEAPQRATIPHALHNPVRESLSSPGSLDQHGPILPSHPTRDCVQNTHLSPQKAALSAEARPAQGELKQRGRHLIPGCPRALGAGGGRGRAAVRGDICRPQRHRDRDWDRDPAPFPSAPGLEHPRGAPALLLPPPLAAPWLHGGCPRLPAGALLRRLAPRGRLMRLGGVNCHPN